MVLNITSPTDLSGFYVIYNTTIKNEKKGTRGISHFIEHLICKNFDHLMSDFEKDGINWNAYTSDNNIVFYITGLDEYLNKYKNIFLDKLLNFNIDDKIIENEKKIILEEYKDVFNNQNSSHFLNLYRKLLNNYNSIGEYSDIINFDKDMIYDYKNRYYYNPSKIINVSKYNNFETSIKFNNFNNKYDINYIKNNDFIYQKSNTFKNKTSIIILSPIIYDDFPYVNFITSLLGNGLKSPLYQEIRENHGLSYYINCYLDQLTDTSSIVNISTEISNNKSDHLILQIKNIFNNIDKYITKERLDIVKKSYEIYFKKSEINRYSNVYKYISPENCLIEPILNTITLDKIYYIFEKYFNINNFYISIDKKEF